MFTLQQMLRYDRWGLPVRTSEAELYRRVVSGQKTRPLNFRVQSGSYAFSISPLALPSGKIEAIRVQDIARQEWFNYDNGVWDRAPEVTVGGNLYIAAYAVNESAAGLMQLIIKDDAGAFLAVKQENVAAGAHIGAETGTIEMPNRQYGILILVEP